MPGPHTNIAKLLMTVSGPFWSARVNVIHFDNPGRGQWALRDLLIDTTPLTRLGSSNELLPGTRLALCSVQQVQLSLGGESYTWNRSTSQVPANPSIEDIKNGLASGQMSLLLLETDPESWPPNLTSASPEFTCLAGEINLDMMSPAGNARNLLYQALTLSPPTAPEGVAQPSIPLSVHSSGLSIYGRIELPWQADKPIQAPFQLARLLPDPDPSTPGYRLTIETERLTPEEKNAIIAAWGDLSRDVNPDNPLTQTGAPSAPQAPAWVTLEVANPQTLPRLYWLASPWQKAPQALALHFERGEINLLVSDRSPYQEPTSLARATLEDVGIAEKNGDLTITGRSGQAGADGAAGALTYAAQAGQAGWEEAYAFSDLELAFSPLETPKFLRDSQALPTPNWVPGSEKPVDPAILWGFMPLEDGWAQLPVPNLSEQIYLDAGIDTSSEPAPANAMFQGAVAYGNEADLTAGLQPWNLTLTGAQHIQGTWTLTRKAQEWDLAGVQLQIDAPEIIANGLFWLSSGKPTVQDALPNLDDWVAGLRQIPLHTVKPSDPFPAPVTLGVSDLEFKRRLPAPKGDPGAATPQLGSWSFSYDLKSKLLEDAKVLPANPLSGAPPLVWLRHPVLPMVQALPLTESKNPPNFPSASRQLVPFELPLPGTQEGANPWMFGVDQSEGAAYWPRLTSAVSPAAEWQRSADLPLVSLSLPGLALEPKKAQNGKGDTPETFLPLKYRFDLPYTDQINALAQLPKVPKDPSQITPLPDQPPPEPARPWLRGDLAENWGRLGERASLAAADGVEALEGIEGTDSLRHLVEPLDWPVRTQIDLSSYPGSLGLDNAGAGQPAPLELSGPQALEGISGEFIPQDGDQIRRLAETETPPEAPFKIVAGSMAAYREADGTYRDQRGLRRGATLSTQGGAELNLLRTPVSLEGQAPYELISSRAPIDLRTNPQAGVGQGWQVWFRDLPAQGGVFDRQRSRSPLVQQLLLDVNDPQATSREYNYLNGYEWRLSGPSGHPLQIYNLPFYPLALEAAEIQGDSLKRLELTGRLQLPLPGGGEQADLSNTLRLTFEAEPSAGTLVLSAVALEPVPDENGKELPGIGEWPLAMSGGEAADAPLLTWTKASLKADRSSLVIEGAKLNFHLFDTLWSVDVSAPLEFPAELGQDPLLQRKIELKPDGGQALAPQAVHLGIDMSPAHAHSVSVEITAALAGRRGNLQALYTFEEGGGVTVHDSSGVGMPLDLTADDSQGLNWAPNGLTVSANRKIASPGAATKIIQAVQDTGELSVELWITPADSNQKGPARILTISGNDTERNLTIGQGAPSFQPRTSYNARVRTSEITLGANDSSLLSKINTTPKSLTHLVFTRDSEGFDRLYLNGAEQASGKVGGDFSNWDPGYPLILANEVEGQLPWLGTYRLAAIYNRALSPFEVAERFQAGVSDLSQLLSQRGTFDATLTFYLLGDKAGQVTWDEGKLFQDLHLDTAPADSGSPAILASGTTLQFRWQHYRPANTIERLQLLPGMHLSEPASADAGSQVDAPGFATLEFTPLPGDEVPTLQLRTAFLEALITCRWGSFLQTDSPAGGAQEAFEEQVFGSSAGNLALGYTARWQGNQWEEAFLLNGFLEVKDLISWPQAMQFDPASSRLTLPAVRPAGEQPPLNHYRHSLRILFNQHTIPATVLNTGKGQLLFNFAEGWSWQFLAVVEHQLVAVSLEPDGEAITLGSDRRWTALQEVRLASPSAFKRFLTSLEGMRTTSPVMPTSDDLGDVNFGYLGSGLRKILAGSGGSLDALSQEGRTLLVEASALHWVRQSRLQMPTATTLQFLPGGSQLGMLSSPQDYAPSDPADPQWLLLATPFLGRLQDQGEDGLSGNIPADASPLKVDPLRLIQSLRGGSGSPAMPELALALSTWSETQEQVITFSAMDTAVTRTWSRLDPISLEENWFRLQNPPREGDHSALGSVMAALPDTPARLSRSAALNAAFEARIQSYPPAVQETAGPADPQPEDRLVWRQHSLLVAQGVGSLGSDSHPPYGWHLTGLQLLTSKLLDGPAGGSEGPVRYPAATVLPVRLKPGDRSQGIPLSLAVSPYLGLEFRPSGENLSLRLVAAELLGTDQGSGELRPVASYTWERPDANGQGAGDPTAEIEAQNALLAEAVTWAQNTHNQLCPDSPTAILRFREIRDNIDPDESGEAPLTTTYSFAIVAEAAPPEKLARRVFQVRSRIAGLRFREGQYAGEEMPAEVQAFELAPPQTTGVQPLYLEKRPASQSGQAASWPWGLSALRLSVQYTQEKAGVSGRAKISPSRPLTLWWQAPQFSLQYRAGENGASPAAGLPRLFRARAIKSLLPVVPGLPAPEIELDSLRLAETPGEPGSIECWQPVLPGGMHTLIVGGRPGAMFALRNMLLRQSGLAPGGPSPQGGSLLTSGSLPVQQRMPRPVSLPPNRPDRQEIALQTWASYFEPEQLLEAGSEPVDEAFLAATAIHPAQRLRARLSGLARNTVAPDWDGELQFQFQVDGGQRSDWNLQVELSDGRQTLAYKAAADSGDSFLPAEDGGLDSLHTMIAKADPGNLLWVRVRAGFTPAGDGFAQTLSFPLRVAEAASLPLPLEPRFAYFEDPEYNRRLASSSFHAGKLIQITVGSERVTHQLTLASDRREYTPDGRVALRFDWDDDVRDSSRGSARLEIQRIDANGIPSGPLSMAGISDQDIPPGELKQFALLELRAQAGSPALPLRAGDVLQMKLIVKPPAPSTEAAVILAARIVGGPANPAPEAGYALLRQESIGSENVVACARFAWSPDPVRIELVSPQDLRSDVVRRRAVFQWGDTMRPGRGVNYALQKITASGSTHFPGFDQ